MAEVYADNYIKAKGGYTKNNLKQVITELSEFRRKLLREENPNERFVEQMIIYTLSELNRRSKQQSERKLLTR